MKSLMILFGLPGAGKTYVADILQKRYGYYHHDGDRDIPPLMKERIDNALPLTDEMRDEFFDRLIQHTEELSEKQELLAVAQTFIKEKYRKRLLKRLPQAVFIRIDADESVREHRLRNRHEYPLDIEYAKKMTGFFEKPEIEHVVLENNQEGAEHIVEQLNNILSIPL